MLKIRLFLLLFLSIFGCREEAKFGGHSDSNRNLKRSFEAKAIPAGRRPVGLKIKTEKSILNLRESTLLQAIAIYSDGVSEDITNRANWTLSDSNIAQLDDLSPGKRNLKGTHEGTVSVKVQLEDLKDTTDITVKSLEIISIVVEPTAAQIGIAETISFKVLASLEDGTKQDVTSESTFLQDSTQFAQADKESLNKFQGLKAGVAVISASFGNKAFKASATLTVKDAELKEVTISPSSASITVGKVQHFNSSALYSDGSRKDVSTIINWSSDENKTANPQGLDSGAMAFLGVTPGTTSIRATYKGLAAAPAQLQVNETPKRKVKINVVGGGQTKMNNDKTCDNSCMETIDEGSTIDLAPVNPSGKVFVGWSQSCTGTQNCRLTMSKDLEVTATFKDQTVVGPLCKMPTYESGTVRIDSSSKVLQVGRVNGEIVNATVRVGKGTLTYIGDANFEGHEVGCKFYQTISGTESPRILTTFGAWYSPIPKKPYDGLTYLRVFDFESSASLFSVQKYIQRADLLRNDFDVVTIGLGGVHSQKQFYIDAPTLLKYVSEYGGALVLMFEYSLEVKFNKQPPGLVLKDYGDSVFRTFGITPIASDVSWGDIKFE